MNRKMGEQRKQSLINWATRLGYKIDDPTLINQALTHSSYTNEGKGRWGHNQRLEFLGDAVLQIIISDYIYRKFPGHSEGMLTKMRANTVCEVTLAKKADDLGLGQLLLLGKGEERTGGRSRSSNLADAMESVIGAIYLDMGLEFTGQVVLRLFEAELTEVPNNIAGTDFKTSLQELVQKYSDENIEYSLLLEEGPDHDKRFTVGVKIVGRVWSQGTGKTKKEAEQKAAQSAFALLEKHFRK